ncbi:CidA/LrgA family protein [Periweissella fabalis]|uniref:CidA/LrgA family protein n=1 Tax=Periweissella fabalis TaxID=1070421 RepID=A0A7X6N228_9LACO|nr:CidA/LrgA family protein [Periweissella fabalis]MCM0598984.1 CidA/LrgA family protein [Periweissella fabalis]NKZ23264.1 CidA/LrgA family protein [Periweissella fabalis]
MKDINIPKILKAFFIYAIVLFISYTVSYVLKLSFPKFPVPTPLVGLVLLYAALEFKIVKVDDIDDFSSVLIGLIGFLFVPSGVSIMVSLDILKAEGAQLITIIVLSTIIMLLSVAWTTKLVFKYLTKEHGDLHLENVNGED